ncbi:MAG TPA: GIY-YIG nuclease family protein [Bacteroidota bacterium]|nr:GIY-YIG nuclease family protein [Bacteroidota bacterium]
MAKNFFVYVLTSDSTGKYYIGQCQDINERLRRHNVSDSKSTVHGRPWRLIYSEEFESRSAAVKRESFLKSPMGWRDLQRIKASLHSVE